MTNSASGSKSPPGEPRVARPGPDGPRPGLLTFIGTTLVRGLLALLPIAVTVYVIYWVGAVAESGMTSLLRLVVPKDYVLPPGAGVVAGLLIIFLVGLLTRHRLMQRLAGWFESLLLHIPGVKTLYTAVQDFLSFFDSAKKKDFSKVVMVRVGEQDLLGLVTRESFDGLPDGIGGAEQIAVYIPMSYQIGGFTVIIDRQAVRPIDMSLEEAMKFALTAGVGKDAASPQHQHRH